VSRLGLPWVVWLSMCAGCASDDKATPSSQLATENTPAGLSDEPVSHSATTTVPTPMSSSTTPADDTSAARGEPMVAQFASGGVSVHFAASEDCAFQDSWVDFPQGAGRTVTETERGALAQRGQGILFVNCEYTEGAPVRYSLTMNVPQDGISRTVSFAPELSREAHMSHGLRVTVGDRSESHRRTPVRV
jgi:hypothetical protein